MSSANRTVTFAEDPLPPLELRWREPDQPLPRRVVKPVGSRSQLLPAPPYWPSGPEDRPFDFSAHVSRLIEDVSRRSPELKHIQASRILVSVLQARSGQSHGLQARVTPLRFAKGQLTRLRRGVTFQVQRLFLDDHEYLYLMTFCLPRFLDRDFDDKFITIFHELYHISQEFDGDLRRHQGRYNLHSHSQKEYDQHMAHLARAYLASRPDPNLIAFLRLQFGQLCHRHGGVEGIVVPRPKMVPLL